MAEMAAWLISVTGAEASAIHVAIEIPHGPIVEPARDAPGDTVFSRAGELAS